VSRRRPDPGPSGFLLVDKPAGWTSHDVVDAARGWLGARRVGHLGTLDPLATGLLPLAVRDATRLIPFVEDGHKRYRARVVLGVETDTLDADGRVVHRHDGPLPDAAELARVLPDFEGVQSQVPPMFSAVKRGGVPLHRLARRGQEVEREARRVEIRRLALESFADGVLELDLTCSAGTYVRVLASDLGRRLGCGAHVAALRRLASGPFRLEDAAPVERLAAEARAGAVAGRLLSPAAVLALPVLPLAEEEARRVRHGGAIRSGADSLRDTSLGGRVLGLRPDGRLLAVLELRPGGLLQPLRVLGGADAAPAEPGLDPRGGARGR